MLLCPTPNLLTSARIVAARQRQSLLGPAIPFEDIPCCRGQAHLMFVPFRVNETYIDSDVNVEIENVFVGGTSPVEVTSTPSFRPKHSLGHKSIMRSAQRKRLNMVKLQSMPLLTALAIWGDVAALLIISQKPRSITCTGIYREREESLALMRRLTHRGHCAEL